MARRWNRIAAVGLATALALAAGGGGDDDTTTGGDGGNGGNGGDDGSGKPALPECPIGSIDEAASKPVEITFWHSMTRANEDTLKALTKDFNSSQSDVKVTLVNQTTYTDTLTKYKAGLGTGDLPDLVQIEDTGVQLMIDSQSVLPAQSCVDAEDYDTSDHVQRVVQYYSVQDVLWPVPFNVSNPVLYYNKKAFEKAGLDPENPPATLAEVREAAQAIVDAGAAKFGFAFKSDPWFLEQWLAKAGESYVNNGNGREERATATAFDTEAGREIFSFLETMVDDGLAQNTGEGGFDNLLAIGNENAAMTIDTSAALGTISLVLSTGDYPNVELGVGPMPGPEGEGGVLVGGAALYIVNKSAPEEQEAAWRFAKFLNEPQSQATWSAGTGYIPIRQSAVELAPLTQRWTEEPGYRVAYDQLLAGVENVATAGPVIGDYVGVRKGVSDALASMFSQGTDAATALTQAAQAGDAAIEEYNGRIGA